MTAILKGVDLKAFNKLCDDLIEHHEKRMNPESEVVTAPATFQETVEVPVVKEVDLEDTVQVHLEEEDTQELQDLHAIDEEDNIETLHEKIVATAKVTADVVPESEKTEYPKGTVLVINPTTNKIESFKNAVAAATHFKIHPTTVRTRCSQNQEIHNLIWKYA